MKTYYEYLTESNLNDNFWKWFGDSKVVDSNGNPLVVYHGSTTKFDVFDPEGHENTWDAEYPDGTIFFTDDLSRAKLYGGIIYPVYLSCDTLKTFVTKPQPNGQWTSAEQFLDNSSKPWEYYYDHGIDCIKVTANSPMTGKYSVYAIFSPTQIKSIDNKGTWNPNDPNIYK